MSLRYSASGAAALAESFAISPASATTTAQALPFSQSWSNTGLITTVRWNGKTFFAIANHFNSTGGDDPLFGRFQPPVRSSEVQRHRQAAIVNAFVDELLAADRKVRIFVLGDINDFEFSQTLDILEGGAS